MTKIFVVDDLDATGPIYPNAFRGTPRLAEKLAFLKKTMAEIERLSMEPAVGEALLENLMDGLHATCDLSAMFFNYMNDGVESQHVDTEHGYGYRFSIIGQVLDDGDSALVVPHDKGFDTTH